MSKMTKGYAAYVEKFGEEFEELRGVPWQVQPACGAWWPLTLRDCEWLGNLLERCAAEGRRVTAKEAVDAKFLAEDGVYRWKAEGVEAKSYDEFLEKASRLNFDV